ncbi:MAG: tRNA 2-thiocytidine biosynthesis protein TtcA [Clostridiales bacterium]|nr:tRNA 2-thiocytidine biosynthesis protein TtcA [Clostridiales bacterium]
MKHILGCIRKCDEEFNLIKDGDNIAVGISGGKDSIMLLNALRLYRYFAKSKFNIKAVTVDLDQDNPFNAEPIRKLCEKWEIEYHVIHTQITKIVFEGRKEKNPCSLCSTMRRGAIHKWCKENNCNKIALGHHRDDALQTFMMSLLFEGRISTLSPITWMDRADIEQIRPMLFVPEKEILSEVRKLNLPVTKSKCPANGLTNRDNMRELIKSFQKVSTDPEKNMLLALRKTHNYNLWKNNSRRPDDMTPWHIIEDSDFEKVVKDDQ